MQEPGSPEGSSLSPNSKSGRRGRRRKRTVYSQEQREGLEKFFESNRYPTHEEREALAATLNLQEHQVQVWFKNRRANLTDPPRPTRQQTPEASASTQGPGVAAGPVYPEEPAFPAGPVFPKEPLYSGGLAYAKNLAFPSSSMFSEYPVFREDPMSSGGFPAAGPSVPSPSQAWCDPAQGTQNMVPAAPAPAQGAQNMVPAAPAPAQGLSPVWSQGPDASYVSPDPYGFLSFQQLLSPQEPWLSGQQGAEGPVELTLLQGLGAGTGSQHPGAGAPAPAPVGPLFSEGPMLTGGPAFPGGPGWGNAPPPNPFGGIEATQPSASSHSQAWGDQAQGAQNMVPSAPAPAPGWPEGS